MDRFSQLAESDASILVDTGSCFHVACQTWKVKKGQHFLTTGGLSSMGYWCAAIGACMANDRKKTSYYGRRKPANEYSGICRNKA